jgi:hypothetical protein
MCILKINANYLNVLIFKMENLLMWAENVLTLANGVITHTPWIRLLGFLTSLL